MTDKELELYKREVIAKEHQAKAIEDLCKELIYMIHTANNKIPIVIYGNPEFYGTHGYSKSSISYGNI